LFKRGVCMSRHQPGDSMSEIRLVEIRLGLAHLDRNFGRIIAATFTNCQQQAQKILTKSAGHIRDHSQVEQGNAIVFSEEDITRVRIGVKESINQNLLQVSAKDLLSQTRPVNLDEA